VSWWRRTPLARARWVAIDCETSGLDAARDRLLSVGAVAVRAGRIELASAFHSLVKQDAVSASSNILIHGIGGDAQRAGRQAPEVIHDLARYVGDDVPVGFHAPFDEQVLRRHAFRARQRWVDLATLAPVLFPGRKARLLDEWLAQFGIPAHGRHDALGDAFATAQLLLVALAEAQRQRIVTVEELRGAGRAARWL
jgi:DNA polymerase III subunit epsilon